MNSKKLILVVSIAVVAILAIILKENLSNRKPSEESLKFFKSKISSFTVRDVSGAANVHKKGDIWVVSPAKANSTGDYSTDSSAVTTALEKLANMKKEVLISENSQKQALFEVDTVKGISVEAFDEKGKSQGTVIIGKSGPDWSSNYVRVTNSNQVYTVSGNVRYSFFSDVKRWRDKRILSFDQATVKTLSLVKKDGSTISVAKASDTGTTWNMIAPAQAPAKIETVSGILGTLSQFNAADFQDSAVSDTVTGFSKPELTISVGFSNSSKKITFGTKQNDKYFAKVEGNDIIYLVTDSDFNTLNKDLSAFKNEPPKDTTKVVSNKKAIHSPKK